MSLKTQGTQLYFIDPEGSSPTLVEVGCPTGINLGGAPADQLEDTCLGVNVRTYKKGLRTPGQAGISINMDPNDPSHVRLNELSEDDTVDNLKWVLGYSDGTSQPTLDSTGEDFDLPATRSWCVFEGYVADFPQDFQLNTFVTTEVSVQRSGDKQIIKKTA